MDVVAVSQAPSPESNPNSPLPVIAMVVQYTTIKLIEQKLERFSTYKCASISYYESSQNPKVLVITNKYSPEAFMHVLALVSQRLSI